MKERNTALIEWAKEKINESIRAGSALRLSAELTANPISGDAGFRRYYRLNTEPSLLAVDAPVETENTGAFIRVAKCLRQNGVHTPEIFHSDEVQGFLLIEDLGDNLYHSALPEAGPELLYGEAMMTLLRMQQVDKNTDCKLPIYDGHRLQGEMALFSRWFVEELLAYELNEQERSMLEGMFARLTASALEQTQVWVHRDFHSRNLIVTEGCAPGVIDFQDAVWGPVTYDLVSLFKDCYIRWPREQVRHWAGSYGDMAVDAGLMPPVDKQQFMMWFDWMGMQRHIKVLGIFTRLSLRDNKAAYLKDIPLVIRYVLEVSQDYDALRPFGEWFKSSLIPRLEKFDWYSDYASAGDRE